MNNTLEERSMAFMNCPWKSTAGCNYICETCLHSASDGLKALIDDCNRLGRQMKRKESEDV